MIHSAYNEGKKTLFVGVIDARARGEGENTEYKAPAPVKGSNVFRMLYLYYQVRLLYDYKTLNISVKT